MKFLSCKNESTVEKITKALLANDFRIWEKGDMRRIYVDFSRIPLPIVFNIHIYRSNSGWMSLCDDDGEKVISNGKANGLFPVKIFFDLTNGSWNFKGDDANVEGVLREQIRDEFDPRCLEADEYDLEAEAC